MIFYSSELFFGDEEVAKRRHFHNADAMNLRIIENWNSVVTQNDKVYIIGGVGQFEFILSLNGEKTVMLSQYEQNFYDSYIDSVTTDPDDIYNDEMFGVYLKNMFYVSETVYDRSITRKNYTGNPIKLSTSMGKSIRNGIQTYTIYGAIGEYQRMFQDGINSNIFVNGMFPLSESDIENLRKHFR